MICITELFQQYRHRAAEQQRSRGKYLFAISFLLIIYMLPVIAFSQVDFGNKPDKLSKADVYKNLPDLTKNKGNYSFIENKGQWSPEVLFMANSKSLRIWITKKAMVFEQFEVEELTTNDIPNHKFNENRKINAHAVALEFVNPDNVSVQKFSQGKTLFNYLIGRDKSKHATGVRQFEEVRVDNIYEGIDMKYYFEMGELRYDFIVKPNANPNQIEMEIKGSEGSHLLNGELVMNTSLKPVIQKGLQAYQKNDGNPNVKDNINANFHLQGNILKLLIGNYDKSKELIIDPLSLLNSKVITNQGNDFEVIKDLTIDDYGNILFIGETIAQTFPGALGSNNGLYDIIIGKTDENLYTINWVTFFGGSNHEYPYGIDVDNNYVYFTGYTSSNNYPLLNEYHSTLEGLYSSFFTKLDINGENIYYSTYLDNNAHGLFRIKVGTTGNVYLSGSLYYDISNPFDEYKQITEQTHVNDHEQGFIIAFVPDGVVNYIRKFSTLFGGDEHTLLNDMDIDDEENIYITGFTESSATSFAPTPNAYDVINNQGNKTGFVAKLHFNEQSDKLVIDYNTFYAESSEINWVLEGPVSIIYNNDKIYFGGFINSDQLPIVNAFDFEYSTDLSTEAFLAVIEPKSHGNDDLIYSSYFGGNKRSFIWDLAYDKVCNKIIFVGETGSELQGYTGDLNLPFSSSGKTMVGVVDIFETGPQTLIELAYLGDYYAAGFAVRHNPLTNRIYAGGRTGIGTNSDMAIYSLNKNFCETIPTCACPSTAKQWLDITAEKGADGCAPNQCRVTHRLHIPEQYQCYSYIRLSNDVDGESIWNEQLIEFQGFNITDFNICIPEGRIYTITLKLYRSLNDNNPCIISKTVYCNIASVTLPCTKDCDSIEWTPQEPLSFDVEDCPGCKVIVTYWTRKACGFQDIQVTSIEKKSGLIMDFCCLLTDEQLFIESIRAIIKENKMEFDPITYLNPCSDIYRVSQATCWASWTVFIDGDGVTLPQIYFVTKPCNNECCSRRLRVCRNQDETVDIYDLGPGEIQSSCENVTLVLPNQVLDCFNRCSSLENIANVPPLFPKAAADYDMNTADKVLNKSSINPVYVTQNNNSLNVTFSNASNVEVSLRIFGILGNLIHENKYLLSSGTNSIDYDLNSLSVGLYFYQISIDGVQIATDKIILVK